MELRRKISLAVAGALVAATAVVAGVASPALAAGSNDVLLQFDQEMRDSGLGIPATNRFAVTVDGVPSTVTAVAVVNDDPPDLAILDLTIDGAAPTSGQSVTVRYTRPITSGSASLRDLEGNQTRSFGPVTVPVL